MRRLIALLAALAAGAASAAPRVATDIAPIHSIAARVMAGVATPELIVPPGASEHDYALRPSEAALLQDADLVVWVGPTLTPWLVGPIAALAPTAALVTLEDAPGIATLLFIAYAALTGVTLSVNTKTDATSFSDPQKGDISTQMLLAHLPLLFAGASV